MNKSVKPPKFASWLFSMFIPFHDRESFLFDMKEVYNSINKNKGRIRAHTWIWMHFLRSLPSFFKTIIYWSITMFKNYLKIAFRSMKRQKGFSLINISGLAVGMACCIIILLWVEHETSWDKFHNNLDRLYRVAFYAGTDKRDFNGAILPGPVAEYLKEKYPEIIKSTNYRYRGQVVFKVEDKQYPCKGVFVHPDFLEMFSFPVINGDIKTALSDPRSIVITEETAVKIFGSTDITGKTLNGLQITGVIKNVPVNSSFQFDFLIPFALAPQWMNIWDNKAVSCYVKIDKNVSPEVVDSKIANVLYERFPEWKNFLYLQPVSDMHLHSLGGGGRITYVYMFSLMGIIILLFACINFMNLSTARSETRFREIGMRKVVGSSRKDLIKQFLFESVLYTFISFTGSICLAVLLIPYFNSLLGTNFTFTFSPDMVFKLLGIAVFTGIISGSYPAFYLSSFNPVMLLKKQLTGFRILNKGKTSVNGSNVFVRRGLVTIQFSLSTIFVICLFVIYLQLSYMKNADLGFEKDNIVVLNLPGNERNNAQTIKSELLANPNIISVTTARNSQTEWNESAGISWEGKASDELFDTGRNYVDYDYLETFKLKMVSGRFFSPEFPSELDNGAVINEAAVRKMGLEDPVGKKIIFAPGSSYERTTKIIGVIKDYHTESFHKEIRPFILYFNENSIRMFLRINSAGVQSTLSFIRSKVKEFTPDNDVSYHFLDREISSLYDSEDRVGGMISNITIIAVIISALGLLGLTSFTAQRRKKEIGIRKVLGANIFQVTSLITREFLVIILLANIIAWPVVYYVMNKWLQDFVYKISFQWWIFVLSGLFTVVIAVLTIGYQSVKAAAADPVDSLKYE
ncbi:ABC transporter permease [candidate division KSB1 bacterium]